ncbi:MAG TPA: hypothetical protein P5525_05890, partial [Candidatus Paceibacterota bacterium]|nr:hypothetical protein [Candidatus Paceibacterota bacterium]
MGWLLWWLGGLLGCCSLAEECHPLSVVEPRVVFEVVEAGCLDWNWISMYVGNPSSCHLNEDWDID